MLTIRREQMVIFENENWRRLAIQASAHLRTYFPVECTALGEHSLNLNIDAGIQRARGHGLDLTYDFLRYLNLAIVFGWDFDTHYDWAAEILNRREFGPHTRMDLLTQRALDELNWVDDNPETLLEAPEEAIEDESPALDGLEDEEPGQSLDGDEPEPLLWEPEEPPPVWELDPDVDYTAHEADFRDG